MSKLAIAAFFLAFSQCIAVAQTNLFYQSGNPGDNWNFSSTGADATAAAQAISALNYTSGPQSLVVGGNTSGGSCIDGGSGNGPSTARTFTFDAVDISTSNQFGRTLTFNWGNRQPVCTGTGWDTGENLIFTPIHNGQTQANITVATGANDAVFNIANNTFTYTVPPCVNSFSFILSINTNRRDELLFLDDVLLTTPSFNVPQEITSITMTVCPSDLPFDWNGVTITAAGVYDATLTNAFGCDSLLQLTVTIGSGSTQNVTLQLCEGDFPYQYNGETYNGPGTFTQVFENTDGCDSLVVLTLVQNQAYFTLQKGYVCSDFLPEIWYGQTLTESGVYTVNLTSQAGCDSIIEYTFTVYESPSANISFSSTTVFSDNPVVTVTNNSQNATTWDWVVPYLDEPFTIDSVFSPTITFPSEPGTYEIQFHMFNDVCIVIELFYITVVEPEFVWNVNFPNVFSPNNDGANDVLSFDFSGLEFVEIVVKNRWGQVVFETQDQNNFWDGRNYSNGELSSDGVYFYQITLRNPLQEEKTFQQFVHLIRE